MDNTKVIPFPQADDINKVLKIINISKPDDLKVSKTMQVILGDITSRQVQYYINAVAYLDILDSKKEFTPYGNKVRAMNQFEQKIALCQKISSKDVFGEVYFSEKVLDIKYTREEIIDVMKKYVTFQSDEIYNRRAQTVYKWVEWMNNNI